MLFCFFLYDFDGRVYIRIIADPEFDEFSDGFVTDTAVNKNIVADLVIRNDYPSVFIVLDYRVPEGNLFHSAFLSIGNFQCITYPEWFENQYKYTTYDIGKRFL